MLFISNNETDDSQFHNTVNNFCGNENRATVMNHYSRPTMVDMTTR